MSHERHCNPSGSSLVTIMLHLPGAVISNKLRHSTPQRPRVFFLLYVRAPLFVSFLSSLLVLFCQASMIDRLINLGMDITSGDNGNLSQQARTSSKRNIYSAGRHPSSRVSCPKSGIHEVDGNSMGAASGMKVFTPRWG